jgi:hypothetical protein
MHRAENQAHSECGWKPGDEGVGMDSSRSEPDKWRTKNRKERGRHCLLSKHLAARPPVQAALRLASLGLDGTRPTLQTRSLEEAMPAISCQRVQLRPAWEQKTLDRIGLLMEAATEGSGFFSRSTIPARPDTACPRARICTSSPAARSWC